MTQLDYSLDALREQDYAVARAIGCSVINSGTAMYSTNRYAALDAIYHYAWLRGYRAHFAIGENGDTHASLLQVGKHPRPLLVTVASANADKLETAIVAVILHDVNRRGLAEQKRLMSVQDDDNA